MVGLGKNHGMEVIPKGWGQRSFLSKAHNKALTDVAAGKQLSIFGALRVAKP
jgi:hypothetical protein